METEIRNAVLFKIVQIIRYLGVNPTKYAQDLDFEN